MKIAFISYEFIPDTGFGGIATYVWHASRMLTRAGHHVEVVCGSPTRTITETLEGVIVHRIRTGYEWGGAFGPLANTILSDRHREVGKFDVIESPECNAEGAEFAASHPDVALVVKLHTPTFMLRRLEETPIGILQRMRFAIGALRRGQWRQLSPGFDDSAEQYEKTLTLAADRVAAPCRAIAQLVGNEWGLPPDRIKTFPYPMESTAELAELPYPQTGPAKRILFVGRLELRKGVQHLGRAFRLIHSKFPNVNLRCVGRIRHGPVIGEEMNDYIRRQAGPSATAITFSGPLPRECLVEELATADVCVFPSLWENFPNVCLEAMVAARPIVGSSAGGMADMLGAGAGVLVTPGCPRRWASAILKLLADGGTRRRFGEAARARAEHEYNYNRVVLAQMECYEEAYRHRREAGPRSYNAIPSRPRTSSV